MADRRHRQLTFTLVAIAPTLLLLLVVAVMGWQVFRSSVARAHARAAIQGTSIRLVNVPMEKFDGYQTLPANSSFTTYFPRPGENITTYSINSHGMRDVEIPRHKARTELRIAVIGDSFTEGILCDRQELYTVVLERLLNSTSLPAGIDHVRVMNFGVRAECPARYVKRLEKQVLPLKPDIVIVQTYDNDAWDVFRELPLAQARGVLEFLYDDSNFWRNAIKRVVSDLEQLRLICQSHGLPMIVVHVPTMFMFDDEAGHVYFDERYEKRGIPLRRHPDGRILNPLEEAIVTWTHATNTPFVSMHKAFATRKQHKQELFYWRVDGHLNARGHAVMATELAPVVQGVLSSARKQRPT